MNRIIFSFFVFCLMFMACSARQQAEALKRPNVLFIAVDDLRPELGCYGSPIAITPNIDRLAARGLVFNRAYCQQAICGPSRASIMTGTRPESTGVIHNYILFRQGKQPDIITLPQHFRNNGYETVYVGKVFHGKDTDEALSWSRQPAEDALEIKALPKPQGFVLKENIEIKEKTRKEMFAKYGEQAKYGLAMGPAWECADVPDQTYVDGYNTDLAIATLRDMLERHPDRPFFLGFGMKKPHLNWVAPKKYWDLYDPEKIPLAENTKAPLGGAPMGLHASFELRVRSGIPKKGAIDPEMQRTLKHAYLACVSYVDAQIGRMVQALEEEGVLENTVIVLWSDHGWHLGDMGIWGKATNYEIATRVPLIVAAPQVPASNVGMHSDALVELVDVYPTLCDLCGLEKPEHLEGQSFVPLLKAPQRPWKTAVFSQFPTPALREWAANPLSPGMRETYFGPLITQVEERIQKQFPEVWNREFFEQRLMGYAMRTDRYRLVVWKDYIHPEQKPIFFELYDHQTDPQETKNIALEKPELVQRLLEQFSKGWKGNLASVER